VVIPWQNAGAKHPLMNPDLQVNHSDVGCPPRFPLASTAQIGYFAYID
jgi:hypothetical protein